MNYKIIITAISIILSIIGTSYYIRSILLRKTKPHILSFIIWVIVLFIGFLGQIYDNGGIGAYLTLSYAILNIIIVFLAIKYGINTITKTNIISIILIIISIVFWIITNGPFISIIIITIIDSIGYIPTLQKIKNYPFSEDLIPWNISNIVWVLSIIGLENYSFITCTYPVAIILMNIILILVSIYYRKINLIINTKKGI